MGTEAAARMEAPKEADTLRPPRGCCGRKFSLSGVGLEPGSPAWGTVWNWATWGFGAETDQDVGGLGFQEAGRRRVALPREEVEAPPAHAQWGPGPRRRSRQPRVGSQVWSVTLRSGSSARGRRHPAAARPVERWMSDSPRPLGRGGEVGLEAASPHLQHP